ncbi:MAG: hypothetical protein A2W00_11765 [Candidatus Eisenbacteria bacterium RBG_16_71_46]|nr:MAG: hypothetical protein A2W00_11765 [Candidatus Eisenbacteria bacterium RBG_16_71_46]
MWLGLLPGGGGAAAATVALLLACAFGFVAWRGPDRVGTVALLAALLLAGFARGAAGRAALERERARFVAHDGLYAVAARVVEPPRREAGEPVAVVRIDAARPPLLAGTRARLRLPAGSDAEWGDGLEALARLEVPPSRRNPGGGDARAAAAAAGLAAGGRAFHTTVRPGRGLDALPRATLARWRRALERCYATGLEPAARELVVPLILGDRSGVSPDLGAHLRASGLVHLLALSGLHVAWLAALARGLAAAAGGGVRARALAGATCAALYLGIAGPLPSLARAAATELFGAGARLLGRALDPLQALALGAVTLLALEPGWARDLGFQLSCAATLGLVTAGPWLATAARGARLAMPLVATASAQLTALPLLLARFHAVAWAVPITNLVAVPIAGLLVSGAWLGAIVELALPGAGRPLFAACELLAALLRAVAEAGAALPAALIGTGGDPLLPAVAGAGATMLALGLAPARDLASRGRPASCARVAARVLGGALLATALGAALGAQPLRPPPGRYWLVVLDVGQGDATALGFADGWWLVDAGPRSPRFDAGEGIVLPFLRWAGVRRLAALALTHDDGDHTGGVEAVRRGVGISRILAPPALPGAPGPGARFGAATARRGDTLRRDPELRVLWPPPSLAPRGDNAASLVLELGAGPARSLLAADADSMVEDSLEVTPGAAVLKVAHHGSATSSGARFLARLAPRVAAISCGRRNPFGHPDRGVLARLAAAGCEVRRTDLGGALWFEIGPDGARALDWRRGPPREPAAGPGARSATLAAPRPRW